MKIVNFFAFVVLLILPNNAFNQSLSPKDLVGKWQNTDGKDLRIWDFKNDSVATFDNGEFHFRLASSNYDEVLIMNYSNHDSAAVWKIKKINDDLVNLIISSLLAVDPKSKNIS
jgi:hypothetical protein